MATLHSNTNGQPIPVGGTAYLDDNLPVTIVSVHPPIDEADPTPGEVLVRHSWGVTEPVQPGRLNTYISLD